MKIQINTSSYNDKRYGKPYIATVDFQSASKSQFKFGEWCGEQGREGLLEINIEIGDIIATGQKDHRKPRNSAPDFYIVEALPTAALESWCNDDMNTAGFKAVSKKDAYLHAEARAES